MIDSVFFWSLITVFWASVALVFYSYAMFPLILSVLASGKKLSLNHFTPNDELPLISILISAYNEQEVIKSKIESVFNTSYPLHKLEVLVGSDASDDQTNIIMESLLKEYPQLKFFPFTVRSGKGNVINWLVNESAGDILIFTDANVMLNENTIFELVKYFKDPSIGLVDTRMLHFNLQTDGISTQENAYISREVMIKQHESILWGTMMGPFGGCYAIRKTLYNPVPKNFLVDDFYINMKILENGYKCINNLDAKVYEDVSNNLSDEFRRKVRISTGNFQNLRKFSNLLLHQTKGLSFCFISHKVLRWTGPFFILGALLASISLAFDSDFYLYALVLQLILILLVFTDLILKKTHIHFNVLRFNTHFYTMNLALLIGFFKSFKNIETNVWKPTQRNQA